MKIYVFKNDNHLDFQVAENAPENIGYDKLDFDEGCWIEITEEQFEYGQEIAYYPNAFELLFPKQYYYIYNERIIILKEKLNPLLYKIGSSYDDSKNGMFVELNNRQIHYYLHHRNYTPYQIWNQTSYIEANISDVRNQKLIELEKYNNSNQVNRFIINNSISAWLTPEERSNYLTSINAAKLLEVSTLKVPINNQIFEVQTSEAEKMLAAIQLYADNCYIVTKEHENAIKSFKNIEEINNYNFKLNYPEQLKFNI